MNRKTIWRLDQAKRKELEPEWEKFASAHEGDMPWLFDMGKDSMGPPLMQRDDKTGKPLYDEERKNRWINNAAWNELKTILEGYAANSLILSIGEANCLNVYRDVKAYINEKLKLYVDAERPFSAEVQVTNEGDTRLIVHSYQYNIGKWGRETTFETISAVDIKEFVKMTKPIISFDKD